MSLSGLWTRFVSRRPAPAERPAPAPAAAPPVATTSVATAPRPPANGIAVEAVAPERHDERHVRFFCWLVGVSAAAAPGAEEPPAAVIGPLLERLDEVIASDALRANLLPRAPHVVPHLMKTLRDESYSSVDVASRISRDVVLSAEVIKSATAVYRAEEDEGEIDLARAVQIIGTAGLRRAIASVVLRPIFESAGDTLSAKAAVKIWRDADRKARLSAALAGQESLDPFDGYLAGLLHNSGWTAMLRAIDGFEDLIFGSADLAHPAVVPELLRRRDALFGAIVAPWNLSPAIDRLAEEVGKVGLDAARSPLGLALREANRLAAVHALAPAGHRPAAAVPGWATLSRPVQDCYLGLSRTA